jgi:hypothetical protein
MTINQLINQMYQIGPGSTLFLSANHLRLQFCEVIKIYPIPYFFGMLYMFAGYTQTKFTF